MANNFIKDLSIDLEKKFYTPNETINGTLKFNLFKDIRVNSINLIFKGDVNVYWYEFLFSFFKIIIIFY